jgi:hypothetical protein
MKAVTGVSRFALKSRNTSMNRQGRQGREGKAKSETADTRKINADKKGIQEREPD